MNIDLHIHSTASDGTASPTEILHIARKLDIAAIAITDHDTLAGSKEAMEAGIPESLHFLTGIEISANAPRAYPCSGSFHILGYGMRLDHPALNRTLEVLQDARKNRNPGMIERLNRIGMDISLTELAETFGKSQIGRPHIARLMMEKGFVSSIDEAFDLYLGQGKPAYIGKYRIECDRAIAMILEAGGVPVLAHPALLKPLSKSPFEDLIRILKDMGIRGVEVYYPEHTPHQTRLYAEIAERYDLLMTGGTDFHGSLKPDIQMGSGKGDFSVPYLLYEKLAASI